MLFTVELLAIERCLDESASLGRHPQVCLSEILFMNIWIVNHYAIPPGQPGGTRHHDLALHLMRRGHRPMIVACNFNHWSRMQHQPLRVGTHIQTREEGVPYRWIRSTAYGSSWQRLLNMLLFALRLQRIARWHPDVPDVVVGSSPHLLAALSAWMLARRLSVPFVLEIRDIWPLSMVEVAGLPRHHPVVLIFSWIEKFLYRRADGIVSLLPGTKNHLKQRVTKFGPYLWLPNGINIDVIEEAPLRSEAAPFTLLYAGSHGDANHLDTILDAADILQQNHAAVRIDFIGQGPEKPRLMSRARSMGLLNVSFENPIPKHDVYSRLAEADAFVIALKRTSLYRFGISLNKLFDYMAVGRPIIFSGFAYANPVTIAHCGVCVPPENAQALADAIRQLASLTSEKRQTIGRRGRRYVEANHNTNLLAGTLAKYLQTIIEDHAEKNL